MEALVAPSSNEMLVIEVEKSHKATNQNKHVDYCKRALWLRAVVLGGHEGLVAMTAFTVGIGSVMPNNEAMIVTGFVGLITSALSTAIAEFLSVYTQVDIMRSQFERDIRMGKGGGGRRGLVPSPTLIAISASVSYLVGGTMPLVAAGFIRHHRTRLVVAATVAFLFMLVVGLLGAVPGKAPITRSCARVVIGGLMTIVIMVAKNELLTFLRL